MVADQPDDAPRVLWFDDEPAQIKSLSKVLKLEKSPLDVVVAGSLKEARALLDENGFDAVVVDLATDDHDDDGANLLQEVNDRFADIPTMVYSGFLHDPRFADRLRRARPVVQESKTKALPQPLRTSPLVRAIERHAARHREVAKYHPEAITFRDYIRAPEIYRAEADSHWARHGHWVNSEFDSRDVAWLVVSGGEVVQSGENIDDFPDENALHELGRKYNLIPFAYARPALPEETWSWNKVSDRDHYPTMAISIGSQRLIEDFDTGAMMTTVANHLVARGLFDFPRTRDGVHLGTDYRFFTKRVEVGIRDAHAVTVVKGVTLQVVEDWDDSPFVIVNEARNALIGRDVLRVFGCEVTLSAATRQTTIRHI